MGSWNWLAAACVGMVALSAAADGKKAGYWCWAHPDGSVAACAPLEEQCAASLDGFNRTAQALREKPIATACKWQKTAWQLVMKPPPDPPRYFPTKKMCTAGLSKGERCKEVR